MRRASFKCENCGNYSGLKQINRGKYGKAKIEKVFSPKREEFFFFQATSMYKNKEKEREQATANRVVKLKS